MYGADLGVSLAFLLTIASALLCVWYGAINWNKDANNEVDINLKTWANDEDKIDEAL
ncbi:symporter small accessory protein [Halarcobacter ebronensis]|uniref:symporter small accessory protein n=1 Tax=Halarcobacter ebronensis TaxID=1462615 RepID=UPI0013E92FF8|nr:symporter small accessory protein [Halarcobacter ebronensis]QKF81955.1 hypothetical protein AEBR_1468 [Halarcobacter ebronensis]